MLIKDTVFVGAGVLTPQNVDEWVWREERGFDDLGELGNSHAHFEEVVDLGHGFVSVKKVYIE